MKDMELHIYICKVKGLYKMTIEPLAKLAFYAIIKQISNEKLELNILDKNGNVYIKNIIQGVPAFLDQIKSGKRINFDNFRFLNDTQKEITITNNGYDINIHGENIKKFITMIFAEFDILHEALGEIKREFYYDRYAKIRRAASEYRIYEKNPEEVSLSRLENCVSDVKDSLYALESAIKDNIRRINAVPKNPAVRIFKCNPKKIMGLESLARDCVIIYLEGVSISAKIYSTLKKPKQMTDLLDEAITFLSIFTSEELERVEGWNAREDMDGFWQENFCNIKKKIEMINWNFKNKKPLSIEVKEVQSV